MAFFTQMREPGKAWRAMDWGVLSKRAPEMMATQEYTFSAKPGDIHTHSPCVSSAAAGG